MGVIEMWDIKVMTALYPYYKNVSGGLQKPLPSFYMEVTSLSLGPQFLSDRSAGFMSSIIEELCKILDVKQLWTTPYHPQTNRLVKRLQQMIMHIIGKLGEDKKADWPSHLAEIAYTYNAIQSAVTGYSPHYLMFGCRPRLPVDFVFPTIGSNSTKCVDVYVASIRDRFRTTLWEVQAQLMAEAC